MVSGRVEEMGKETGIPVNNSARKSTPEKLKILAIFILHMTPDLKYSWPSLLCTYSSLQTGGLMLIIRVCSIDSQRLL